jgi:hypothetical protein
MPAVDTAMRRRVESDEKIETQSLLSGGVLTPDGPWIVGGAPDDLENSLFERGLW